MIAADERYVSAAISLQTGIFVSLHSCKVKELLRNIACWPWQTELPQQPEHPE